MSVKRNIFVNFIGQGVASALSLLLVPVYVHYLSIEAYALVGLYGVIQVWLTLLELGMTPTLNREMARFTAGALPPKAIKDLLRSVAVRRSDQPA
jgi:O-antigen/teichoic acid export membrane protein